VAGGIPDEGEEDMLDTLFAGDKSLRLFQNNFTPNNASVLLDFTVADFAGYANITLTGGSWTTTPGAPSVAAYAEQTFTRTTTGAVQTIYGYYIVNAGGTKVWAYEKFATAQAVTSAGDTIRVTPRIKLQDSVD
jgi:hypothetical protein